MNSAHLRDSTGLKFLLRPAPIGVACTALENVESFSSWLHRLGQENALHAPLSRILGKTRRTPSLVESHLTSSTELADLVRATGRTSDEMQMMAFSPPPVKNSGEESSRVSSWLLRDRADSTPHVVCPTCLAADSVPYWRKSWRLAVIVDCLVHGTPMLEKCRQCNRRFSIYSKVKHPLNCCTWCGTPIKRTTSLKIDAAPSVWRDFFYSLSYKRQPLGVKPIFSNSRAVVRLFNTALSYAQAADIGNYWFHCHAGPPLTRSSRSKAKYFRHATIDERRQVLKFVAAAVANSEQGYLALPLARYINQRKLEIWSLSLATQTGPTKTNFSDSRTA